MSCPPRVQGHVRADGALGIRNHVLVVSAMDVINPLAPWPITSAFGRAHGGPERERHERTLGGLIRNPNVAAALIVGFEPDTTDHLARMLADAGKPIETRAVLTDGSTSDLERDGVRLVETWLPRRRRKHPSRETSRAWSSASSAAARTRPRAWSPIRWSARWRRPSRSPATPAPPPASPASIDVDVGPALTGDLALDAAAERVHAALLAVCSGEPTRNERLGDVETTTASVHAWSQLMVEA